MKRKILSTLVILTFGTYVLFQKISGSDNTIVAKSNNNNPDTSLPAKSTPTNNTDISSVTSALLKKVTKFVPANTGKYKNGEYTGVSADAYYGNIQVKATISGGQLTDVKFLDHPQDRGTSIEINDYAMPILRSEAIQAQSSNVDTVSGATDSSGAFRQSLESALSQARNS